MSEPFADMLGSRLAATKESSLSVRHVRKVLASLSARLAPTCRSRICDVRCFGHTVLLNAEGRVRRKG